MAASLGAKALSTLALATLVTVGGCSQLRDHKGYIVDSALLDTVKPGVDNRDSVTKVLGDPTFASAFDSGQAYYYLARDTRSLAFANPKPVAQTLLTVTFDRSGNVTGVNKSGLERTATITPARGKTPTLGSKRGLFSDLFGNIGKLGASGEGSGTADNPN